MLRGMTVRRVLLGLGMMMLLGAQTCTVPNSRYPDYGNVPPGSYLQSCEAARVVYGATLVAQCPTDHGRFVEASLRLPCRGDIANEGGRLICRAGYDGGYDRGAPTGSYQRVCRNERLLRGDLLTAECADRFGRWSETSLRLPCRDDIASEDGRLVCRGTGYDTGFDDAPIGSYRQSCRDPRVYGGDVLVAECRDRFGRYLETDLRLPCRGDIANEGGRLTCLGGGYPPTGYPGIGGDGGLPRGGFVESCTSPRVRDGILTANCPDRFGRPLFASLRLPCDGWVENADGRLVCRR